MQPLKLPPALRPGDTVGVFSPSFPSAQILPERFELALNGLERSLNVRTRVPMQRGDAYLAGTARERADALLHLLRAPDIKAVLCATGGLNSAEILDYLPRDDNLPPKIVIGYSDCTSLLLGLHALQGWCTFYGPNVMSQFGEYPNPQPFTLENLNAVLAGVAPFPLPDSDQWTDERVDWSAAEPRRARALVPSAGREVWKDGAGEGTLYGGNLETLNFLVGTEFLRPPPDIVLFWEVGEQLPLRIARVHRALTHLKQAGIMSRVRAMLVGRSPCCKPLMGTTLKRMVLDTLADFTFPILAEMTFGHTDPMLTIPIGVDARVVARRGTGEATIVGRAVSL